MTEIIVLDIETRIDPVALAASGRSRPPRDMPPVLQVVTAAATLAFRVDDVGRFDGFRLESVNASGNEAVLVATAEEWLASANVAGADLVTFNGSHDLSVLRLALLRGRLFGGGGAAYWLAAGEDRHRDLMLEIAGSGRWARLADVAAAFGFTGPGAAASATEAKGEAEKAELDVCLTALLHIHLEAERHGDVSILRRGLLAFGRFLAQRVMRAPHLAPILASPLYANANRSLGD